MHRSRLAALVLDCATDNLNRETVFWAEALGYRAETAVEPGNERYRELKGGPSQPGVLLQRVAHASRVHLDVETDDVEAEVRRLEKLGAVRVEQVRTWWVMEAPSGHRFCVVRPQRADFETDANVWEDG